jgi:hypothetical protein
MSHDVADAIQDVMIAATQRLEDAGLSPVEALHHHIAYGLACLPLTVCPEHLADELAYIDDALAELRTRVAGAAN